MTPHPRPLSPHLQVYRLPLPAITSILHRMSGVALSVGLLAIVALIWSAASGPEAYDAFMKCASQPLAMVVWAGFTAALYYHLCSGIRHFLFDAGLLLKIEQAEKAGVFILLAAALLTAATWYCILTR